MRDHEIELIAALLEGRLADETEARALIASSSEHRDEYEAQKLAYETLRGMGAATLTDTERDALHRDVWTSLRSGTVKVKPKRPVAWFYRLGPVAAVLFVVVGLAAVLTQGGGDSGEETAEIATELRGDESAVTSTAAAAERAAGGDMMAEGDDGAEATDTTEAMEEAASPLSSDMAAFYSQEAERLRGGATADTELETFEDEPAPVELEECIEAAGLQGHRVIAAWTAPTSEVGTESEDLPAGVSRYIAAILEDADLATAPITFVDRADCTIIIALDP